jgi:4-amino-4-deoxy-L-arabinose transferase-like glycosyltransferase
VDGSEAHEYFHTPGYPIFAAVILWIFGGSFFAVTLAQILLVFATSVMILPIGKRLASEKTGQWASILFLMNPLVPSIVFYILTDVLFMFLLTLGFLLVLMRAKRLPFQTAILAGICFAAAIYVRPTGFIAFPIFLAPLFTLALPLRRKVLAGFLMLVVTVLLLVPWMLRNKIDSGVFSFSSLVPLDMAYYNLPHFWADTKGIPLDQGIAKVAQESGVPEGLDANGYPENWYNLTSSPALVHYEEEILLGSPISYTVWHLYNSLGFFLNPSISPTHSSSVNLKLLLRKGYFAEFFGVVITP